MTKLKINNLPKTNKRIYIAGPMRGFKYFNFEAFDNARDRLLATGEFDEVISPADLDREEAGLDPWDLKQVPDPENYNWRDLSQINLPKEFTIEEALRRDVDAIVHCSHLYMLKGWWLSTGARGEKGIADWIGRKVLHEFNPEKLSREELEQMVRLQFNLDPELDRVTPDYDWDDRFDGLSISRC